MATFAGKQDKLIDALNSMIELDFDAMEAYKAAIERMDDITAKETLSIFMEDHLRHTIELSVEVRSLGGQPVEQGDVKAVLTKGKVVLAGLVGDTAVLRAMKSNEDDTNSAYENIVERTDLNESLRTLLNKNLDDERRHRSWIEAELHGTRGPQAYI